MGFMSRAIAITLGIGSVLLIILQMQDILSGNWTIIGQNIASMAVAIICFGLAALGIFHLKGNR